MSRPHPPLPGFIAGASLQFGSGHGANGVARGVPGIKAGAPLQDGGTLDELVPSRPSPRLRGRGSVAGAPSARSGALLLPVQGRASYVGQTGGLYRYLSPGGGDEDIVTEEYQGTITIAADFAEGTLQGCVGDLVSRREHFSNFLGDEQRFDASAAIAEYEIHLRAAPVEQNGTFGSYDVTVRHPEMRESGATSGFWGGSMSSTPDADGNPRLASGFTVGRFEGASERRGSFVGTFLALSERFRASD